jgi:hypothetical protein
LSFTKRDLEPTPGELMLFVDESGEHGMRNINPEFPILTIVGCAFTLDDYRAFESDVIAFKQDVLGDSAASLHSRDIRKWEGPFAKIRSEDRSAVQERISGFMGRGKFTIISVTIRKDLLGVSYHDPKPPYELAVEYLLERYYALLRHSGMNGTICPESRGKREDAAVADEYSRFRESGFHKTTPAEVQARLPGPIVFGRKTDGCCGLEAADLAAYPIARYVLDPAKANPAFDVLRPKLYAGNKATTDYEHVSEDEIWVDGSVYFGRAAYEKAVASYGLKVFP